MTCNCIPPLWHQFLLEDAMTTRVLALRAGTQKESWPGERDCGERFIWAQDLVRKLRE